MIQYRILSTEAGFVGFCVSERGLRRVYLPYPTRQRLLEVIQRDQPDASEDSAADPQLADDLLRYFAGQRVEFHVTHDWSGWSNFEVDAWRACATIGYGRTASYKCLADKLGYPAAARAIGMAMSHNPCPIIIPCHRVVKSDGSLGGFSGPGGLEQKRQLLDMEAAATGQTLAAAV